MENLPLDILWVGISDSQVCTQSGQAQGIEGARSILVVPQIILSIARKMVNLDVVAHLQQLVQARGWLTGIHVYRTIRLTWRINLFLFGFKCKVVLLIKQQDQTRQSEIPL